MEDSVLSVVVETLKNDEIKDGNSIINFDNLKTDNKKSLLMRNNKSTLSLVDKETKFRSGQKQYKSIVSDAWADNQSQNQSNYN